VDGIWARADPDLLSLQVGSAVTNERIGKLSATGEATALKVDDILLATDQRVAAAVATQSPRQHERFDF
jgi:hypothetical protein